MRSVRFRPRVLLLSAVLLARIASGAGGNLVANGDFEAKGEEPVPGWKVSARPERASFVVEGGVLVGERKAPLSPLADRCFTRVNLPRDAGAVRLGVDIGIEEVRKAGILVNFQNADGSSLEVRTVLPLSGTFSMRRLERDILLPPGTVDLILSLELFAEGRVRLDRADLRVVDPKDIRPEARLIEVTGTARIAADEGPLAVVIPPATESQAVLRIAATLSTTSTVTRAEVVTDSRASRLEMVVDAARETTVTWRALVLVASRTDLPAHIVATPARHLRRRYADFARPVSGPEIAALAKRLPPGDDLTALARAAAELVAGAVRDAPGNARNPGETARSRSGDAASRAALIADLLRTREVPARVVALVPEKTPGPIYGVEALTRESSWVRYLADPGAPAPYPTGRAVLLASGPAGWVADPAGGVRTRAEEVGVLVLPSGATPGIMEALAGSFREAAKKFDTGSGRASAEIDPGDLHGKAKQLADDLEPYLSR